MENRTAVNQAKQVYSSPGVLDFYEDFGGLFNKEKRILEDHFHNVEGKRVLDIGSGTGRVSAALAQCGTLVTAFDFVPQMVERAKRKYPAIDFQVLDVREMPFEAESFDSVWFSFNGLDCISPYSARVKVIDNIYRILKPGGLFVYSSHNSACLVTSRGSRLKNLARNTASLRIFSHYRHDFDVREGVSVLFYQNPKSQERALRGVGFSDVKLYGDFPSYWRAFFSDPWPYYVARK